MIIVWHYRDLRLEDNSALSYAAKNGDQLLPLYIHDPEGEGKWAPGGASRWWLHHSLEDLSRRYKDKESFLAVRLGDSKKVLEGFVQKGKVQQICWIERSSPHIRKRDEGIRKALEKLGVEVKILPGNYLVDPEALLTKEDKPYTVYTPFYKAMSKEAVDSPLIAPSLPPPPKVAQGKVADLELMPQVHWYDEIQKFWTPGREGAKRRLATFKKEQLARYGKERDFPYKEATSRLSPHLHFGEISAREVWYKVAGEKGAEPFLRELAWREFSNYFLFHHPQITDHSWREKFQKFPWKDNAKALKRWQEGMTGYPIVDAGMRELWRTGWMHNRVRMIVASFLIKDLMIHWKRGAEWFWDTLLDADIANNSQGWQWTAGSGADAAPFFRVFNPIIQGQRFDPEGEYIRQYVPELKALPSELIHTPWEADQKLDYPEPMIDHAVARQKALEAFEGL